MKSGARVRRYAALLVGAALIAISQSAPAATEPPPPCTDSSVACLEKIGRLYIEALLAHDGAKIPLAATVRRTENALTNARGPAEVRESFKRTDMVKQARDIRFWTDAVRGEIVFFFMLDIDVTKDQVGDGTTRAGDTNYKVAVTVPEGTYTVHESERFRIVRGFITEIEIIAHVEKGKGAGSGWPAEREAVVSKP